MTEAMSGRWRLRPTALALICACSYAVVVLAVVFFHSGTFPAWDWLPISVLMAGAALLAALFIGLARRRPLTSVLSRAPGAVALQLAYGLFTAAYLAYRPVIQQVVPFWADRALSEIDWWLHLGRHAYTLIPMWPPLTYIIDEVYVPVWFLLTPIVVAVWAWGLQGRDRARAFVAYFLTWSLLGTVLATALSSAGPVYAARIGMSNEYEPLMEYLRTLALRANSGHEALWLGYVGEQTPRGITAMPSMHVAFPTLVTLTFWRWRRLRIAGLVLTGLIVIGSVHLGWHYAVDSYASIMGVLLIWGLVGRLIPEERDGISPSKSFAAARPHPQLHSSSGASVSRTP
jgi:hypothetical protein